MTRLLLVEDVFLLGHDDESGRNTSPSLQSALAGALLLDLADRELVGVDDDGRVVVTAAVPDHPLLARAVDAVREKDKPEKLSHWLYVLPRALKPFDRTVGESLVARGILGEERGKVLGLFPTTTWPERDPAPEQQLRAELRGALLSETDPPRRALLLVGLLQHQGMVDRLVDKPDRKQARRRAKEIAELAESGDAVSKAVGDAARAAQVAIMTSIAASTAATTAATVNSH